MSIALGEMRTADGVFVVVLLSKITKLLRCKLWSVVTNQLFRNAVFSEERLENRNNTGSGGNQQSGNF